MWLEFHSTGEPEGGNAKVVKYSGSGFAADRDWKSWTVFLFPESKSESVREVATFANRDDAEAAYKALAHVLRSDIPLYESQRQP